jgi:proteic killer suppression protein
MIVNFRHKGLKRLYEADDPSKLPADLVERIRGILTVLEFATDLASIDRPTLHLHALKGNLKGFHAVTVRANWRIIFRFDGQNICDVDFVDYH